MTKGRFGNYLLQLGLIDEENKKALLQYQRTMTDIQLAQWALKQNIIGEAQLYTLLAKFYDMELLTISDFSIDPAAVSLINQNMARKFNIVPVKCDDKTLIIAAEFPISLRERDNLRQITGKKIHVVIMSAKDIVSALEIAYRESEKNGYFDQESMASETSSGNYDIVKIAEQLLNKAVRSGCSDIHIEPEIENLKIRFRIDGVLKTVEQFPAVLTNPLISRIKVIAGLNIAEKRAPQDGGLKFEYRDNGVSQSISARVSTLPSNYGEKMVLKIQSFQDQLQKLDNLGFEQDHLTEIKKILSNPHGIFLTTGPSGSGKTTTLYSAINFITSDQLNIITVEDPIERHIKGIIQTQVDQKYSFQSALRSILRQDPDVIMVGEIRDGETARLALQAALTGHMVLSTLHTNDSTSAVTRFIDMGCEAFLVNATVRCVLAQRLVRKLCIACRKPYEPAADELKALAITKLETGEFYKAKGCSICNGAGFKGRIPLFELLVVDSGFKKLVAGKSDQEYLREYAIENKMRTLREDGVLKIRKGFTSSEEVIRATVEG